MAVHREIIVDNERKLAYCASLLREVAPDGSMTIRFADTDESSTARQRRLQWLWYSEVARSGIGSADDKETVHLLSKWQFAIPILLRDCDIFPIVYKAFMAAVKFADNRPAHCREFAARHISTEQMSKQQRAEYLTEFQRWWTGKGVCLTDPSLQGVKLYGG